MPRPRPRRWPLWFLLAPLVALIYPAWYHGEDPTFFGIPFFVWYQMLWIILVALIMGVVWAVTREPGDDPR